MKLQLLAGVAAGVAAIASAHEFQSCSSEDHLHISELDFSPSEVAVPGTDFAVRMKGSPDVAITVGASADVSVKMYGVTLYREKIDLCELVACPLQVGALDLTVVYPVPVETPNHVEVELDVKIVNSNSFEMGCVKTKVKTGQKPSSKNLGQTRLGVRLNEGESLFRHYLKEHSLQNVVKVTEENVRIFLESLFEVVRHNSSKSTFKKALGPFAHLSKEEFKNTRLGYNREIRIPNSPWYDSFFRSESPLASVFERFGSMLLTPESSEFKIKSLKDLPASVDWRKKGAVTPVKDQGACGSCWAFSTTGALEGAYFLKTGKLVSFSEEQLVSCDPTDHGCNGGLMDYAFEWIEEHGGLCSEESYAYTSGTGMVGACDQTCVPVAGSTPTSYVDVPIDSEEALMTAVAQQPVAVAIEADQSAFQLYHSGVVTGTCGAALDHGVLVVGYGTDSETNVDYWIVKNSWGPRWGESGYVRIQRGKTFPFGRRTGECGILAGPPSYPTF